MIELEKEYKKAVEEKKPVVAEIDRIILEATRFLEAGILPSKLLIPLKQNVKYLQEWTVDNVLYKIYELWGLCDENEEKFKEKVKGYKKLQEEAKKEDDELSASYYKVIVDTAEKYYSSMKLFFERLRGNFSLRE
ncbi:MAG: hypothetical protein ACP5HJ_02260 [Candidatus Micrarchaeia archaeon]